MVHKISQCETDKFQWLDMTDPTEEEFSEIASKYNLHPALVADCLQPDHLPKFERMDKYSFIIFRIFTDNESSEADSVQELTNKIAIFFSESFILTIHRKKHPLFDNVVESLKEKECSNAQLLNILIYSCLNTCEVPLKKLSKSVEYFEEVIFLRPRKVPLLKGLYYLK